MNVERPKKFYAQFSTKKVPISFFIAIKFAKLLRAEVWANAEVSFSYCVLAYKLILSLPLLLRRKRA